MNNIAGKIRVVTENGGAKSGSDYGKVDKVLNFKKGEKSKTI